MDPTGFEPAPSSLTGRYATSYTTGPKARLRPPTTDCDASTGNISDLIPIRELIANQFLIVYVRALRGVGVVLGWFLHHFHFKTYGHIFWGETLRVVAALVAQHTVHHIFSRDN